MREMEWPPARGGAELLIDRQRLTVRRLGGLGQTLISGDLEAAIAALAPDAPMLGLGRTSALLVTPAPLAIVDGWREGWCATSVDDGWAAVDISGSDATQALMQATSVDIASGSPSAAVLLFGLRALLARTPFGFRVHLESPWLETLLTWLDPV